MLRRHPRSLRIRQLVAPAFVAGLVGGIPVVLILPILVWPWLAGIIAYLVLNLIATVYTARRHDWRLLWRLPLVFSTMHLAWGVGFWVGVFRLK